MKTLTTIIAVGLMGLLGYLMYSSNSLSPAPTEQIKTEEEFNASGQAKAIENETDMWQIYVDEIAGISFRYPHDVVLGDGTKLDADLVLSVNVTNVDEMPDQAPMGYGKENSLENKEIIFVLYEILDILKEIKEKI